MKELEIKLTGAESLGETIINIDDKPIKIKKNQFGNFVCNYKTDKDKINIKVTRLLDTGGIFWFFTQIFFFLISIFGIFDIHKRTSCSVIDFNIDVNLPENGKISLKFNSFNNNTKAITVETNLDYNEISNKSILDEKAKKTLKILKFTKIFLFLAIVALIVAIIFIKIG